MHRSGLTALGWLEAYARLLLPPVLGLATRHGIGLEAHLQNCVPTFVEGRPHRLALRDLAGMRLYPGRLEAPLWTDLGGRCRDAAAPDCRRAARASFRLRP